MPSAPSSVTCVAGMLLLYAAPRWEGRSPLPAGGSESPSATTTTVCSAPREEGCVTFPRGGGGTSAFANLFHHLFGGGVLRRVLCTRLGRDGGVPASRSLNYHLRGRDATAVRSASRGEVWGTSPRRGESTSALTALFRHLFGDGVLREVQSTSLGRGGGMRAPNSLICHLRDRDATAVCSASQRKVRNTSLRRGESTSAFSGLFRHLFGDGLLRKVLCIRLGRDGGIVAPSSLNYHLRGRDATAESQ